MMRSFNSFRWRPTPNYSNWTIARFASSIQAIRQQTDFGPPDALGAPERKGLSMGVYVVEPKSKPGSFARFLKLAKPHLGQILFSSLCVAIYSYSTLSIPYGFGGLIDYAAKGELPFEPTAKLLALFALAALSNFGRLASSGIAGERVIADLRFKLYKAYLNRACAFFDDPHHRTGAMVQRLQMDCNVAGSALTEALSQGTKNLFQTVGGFGAMLYLCPKLTGFVFCVLPIAVGMAGYTGRLVRKFTTNRQDILAMQAVVAEERLSNFRTVKAFAKEQSEAEYYSTKVNDVYDISTQVVLINASYVAMLHYYGYMILMAIVWGGSLMVANQLLTSGKLFSFMLYTVYCGIGLTGVTNFMTELNKGYGASIRIFDVLEQDEKEAEEQKRAGTLTRPLASKGHYSLKNVTFAYPSRPDAIVFDDLSLELPPGRCTAVVGASGAGKSTLALLLLKLYKPTSGEVQLDGVDLEKLDTKGVRNLIGYVQQEPVLFGGSVEQNIAYGIQDHTWKESKDAWTHNAVVDAATRANAHDFIMALPQQYSTYVGESGKSLSGGQKQRIAIARALIRTPQLLILDEATSALDSESEEVVQETIVKLIENVRHSDKEKNRSVLLFAHRLSMVRRADRIVVLDKGKIVADGPFEDVCQHPTFRLLLGIGEGDQLSVSQPGSQIAGGQEAASSGDAEKGNEQEQEKEEKKE